MFYDVSVLEVYANDRFALSTRVYPVCTGPSSLSITADVDEGLNSDQAAILTNVGVWER